MILYLTHKWCSDVWGGHESQQQQQFTGQRPVRHTTSQHSFCLMSYVATKHLWIIWWGRRCVLHTELLNHWWFTIPPDLTVPKLVEMQGLAPKSLNNVVDVLCSMMQCCWSAESFKSLQDKNRIHKIFPRSLYSRTILNKVNNTLWLSWDVVTWLSRFPWLTVMVVERQRISTNRNWQIFQLNRTDKPN